MNTSFDRRAIRLSRNSSRYSLQFVPNFQLFKYSTLCIALGSVTKRNPIYIPQPLAVLSGSNRETEKGGDRQNMNNI